MNDQDNGYLEGMRCPRCKRSEGFLIDTLVTVHVTADEFEESYEDIMLWHENDFCVCDHCGFEGKIKQFRIRR